MSLDGISLKEPIRRRDIFVRSEVVRFAKNYNDSNIINSALRQSKADKEYYDAVQAFDRGDFNTFLDNFFLAIHSRYDIEKPVVKRYIRRKLQVINDLRAENDALRAEQKKQEGFLKRLSAEYVLMGKDCEKAECRRLPSPTTRKP